MEYVLYLLGALIALPLLADIVLRLFPSLRLSPEESKRRALARKEARRMKRSAVRNAAKKRKKKSGPLFGSRSVEAMLLGENNHIAGRWAARKARDKFFRF